MATEYIKAMNRNLLNSNKNTSASENPFFSLMKGNFEKLLVSRKREDTEKIIKRNAKALAEEIFTNNLFSTTTPYWENIKKMAAKIVAANQQQRKQTLEKIKQMLVPTKEEKVALTQELNNDATEMIKVSETIERVMGEVDKAFLSPSSEAADLPSDLFDPFFKELAAIIYDNLPENECEKHIQEKREELEDSLVFFIENFLLHSYALRYINSLHKVATTIKSIRLITIKGQRLINEEKISEWVKTKVTTFQEKIENDPFTISEQMLKIPDSYKKNTGSRIVIEALQNILKGKPLATLKEKLEAQTKEYKQDLIDNSYSRETTLEEIEEIAAVIATINEDRAEPNQSPQIEEKKEEKKSSAEKIGNLWKEKNLKKLEEIARELSGTIASPVVKTRFCCRDVPSQQKHV